MLNQLVDTRDVKFVLFELLEVDKMNKFAKFADFDRETFESTIDLAEKICVEQIYPTNAEGDKQGGSVYDPATKKVTVPSCYRPVLDEWYKAGFFGLVDEPEHGGSGMPNTIGAVTTEYICAANYPLGMFPGLAHGAMELLAVFGTDEQKHAYMPKMMSGEWGGTMCLTEPDAGSDVGALKTKAVKQADGTYKITGQKIFISAGENDYYKNIIHPVLARIEGDLEGTKGISIFIVPKYLVNTDGSAGAAERRGLHRHRAQDGHQGLAPPARFFGDNGKCVGYLLGEERQGMKIMFQMMNDARMGVAMQGQANRLRGVHARRHLRAEQETGRARDPDAQPRGAAGVDHQSPRRQARMLLWMKSHVEGQRVLIYYMFHNIDLSGVLEGDAAKEANGLVEMLTPISKAGCTDKSVEITSEAMQVYGGYGYCGDYPVEQIHARLQDTSPSTRAPTAYSPWT